MKRNRILIISAFALALPLTARALPVKFPDCANTVQVKDPAGGAGTYLNEDCTVLYVLPNAGLLTIKGYRPYPRLDVNCDRLNQNDVDEDNFAKYKASTSARLVEYERQIAENEENLRDGLIPAGKSAQDLQAQIDALVDDMTKLRAKIATMEQQDDASRISVANIPGGSGTFLIQNSWSNLVAAYQKANPKLKVIKMPIDESFLSMNERKSDASDAT